MLLIAVMRCLLILLAYAIAVQVSDAFFPAYKATNDMYCQRRSGKLSASAFIEDEHNQYLEMMTTTRRNFFAISGGVITGISGIISPGFSKVSSYSSFECYDVLFTNSRPNY
jgi:hypothetical protein